MPCSAYRLPMQAAAPAESHGPRSGFRSALAAPNRQSRKFPSRNRKKIVSLNRDGVDFVNEQPSAAKCKTLAKRVKAHKVAKR